MGGSPPKPDFDCPETVVRTQPNRPLSSGIRVVPIRATPPPAISCVIPNLLEQTRFFQISCGVVFPFESMGSFLIRCNSSHSRRRCVKSYSVFEFTR